MSTRSSMNWETTPGNIDSLNADLQEDAQRDEHERGEKLVGRAEERPDIRVADLGEQEAERQRESRREIRVAKELAPRLGMRLAMIFETACL